MFQNKKNQLDEMQEQKLLHIEKNTCWFAFWTLGLSMIVQMIVFKAEAMSHIAGEWIVFMCMCIYLTSACMKAGIWDRRLKADAKTNAIVSVIAGLATAVINSITFWVNLSESEDRVVVMLIVAGVSFVMVAGACFVALSLAVRSYKKRLAKMEEEVQE